jgi:hypothetical protein
VIRSTQIYPNIAQNGALVNKSFCPKKLLVKIRKFKCKKLKFLERIWVNFVRNVQKKSPNLVTLHAVLRCEVIHNRIDDGSDLADTKKKKLSENFDPFEA